jgi:hypothetical protein
MTLCTTAKLARLGWVIDDVRVLIEAIATEANDKEIADRLIAVETTFDAYAQRQPISGEERFTELLGVETAQHVHNWASSPGSLKQLPISTSIANAKSTATADLSTDSGTADAFAQNSRMT